MSGQLQFLGSENPNADPRGALFHVIPAPIERSVSYGAGTARGPQAILEASEQLEPYDGLDVPLDHGVYTWPAVETEGDIETVFARLEAACARSLAESAVPVVLGGEHSLTLAAVRAAMAAYPTDRASGRRPAVGIVQIDAHGDLRDSYHGNRYSHAAVMRRCHDLDVPIHAVGVRALSPDDLAMRRAHPGTITFQDAAELVPTATATIELPAGFPEFVYLTIDVDGLDPAIISATGTPEPGGLGWYQSLALIESVARARVIVAFDLVELAPIAGRIADDFAAARLVYQVMGIIGRNRR